MVTTEQAVSAAHSARGIRFAPVESCPVCDSQERCQETDEVRDHVCGLYGKYRYVRCLNCSLIYEDPRPIVEDLPLCYRDYHTHEAAPLPESFRGPWSPMVRWIRGGILGRKFGYTHLSPSPLAVTAACLLDVLPPIRRRARCGWGNNLPVFRGEGRALDIGTGGGVHAASLARLGWEVTALEFDSVTAEATSRRHNLNVLTTTIEEAHFPDDCFDLVSMFQVIEHLPDPVGTLRECYRVMKPGTSIMIDTPNYDCLTRRKFGRYWRGFEAPRHLMIFNAATLSQALESAGFRVRKAQNSPGATHYFVATTLQFRYDENGGAPNAGAVAWRSRCYNLLAALGRPAGHFWGDVLHFEAVK